MSAVLALAACTAGEVVSAPPEKSAAQPWRAVDAQTGKISDAPALEQLAKDFPDSSSVRLRLLNAYFEAGETDATLRQVEWLAARGYVLSDDALQQLLGTGDTETAQALFARFKANAVPSENSTLLDIIPANALLVEGVAALEGGQTLLANSIVSRDVFIRETQRAWRAAGLKGVSSLTGMAAQPDAALVWLSAGRLDVTPVSGSESFTGLLAIDPRSASIVRKIPSGDGITLSDIHVAGDGTVYASDPLTGGVYRAKPGVMGLETVVARGVLRSPQGLTTSADGQLLYVSDYRYGIAIIDLMSGKVGRLVADSPVADSPMVLDGIDGLFRHGDSLIAIQNGMRPMRIVKIDLAESGRSAAAMQVLESAHSAWTEPVGGSISGGQLVYIATGQWDRFGDGGVPVDTKPPLPTQVRKLQLPQ